MRIRHLDASAPRCLGWVGLSEMTSKPRRSRTFLWGLRLACSCAVVVQATHAYAAPGIAEAETLFEEGKRLVAAGKIDEGCSRFEESLRIDRAGGTLLHLAACREQQ